MGRAACMLMVLLAVAGPGGPGVRWASGQVFRSGNGEAEGYENVLFGGMPNQNVMNGLWWDGYNAFSPPYVRPGAFAAWWDNYIPPYTRSWNGPYFSVAHWDPYVPRPVRWSGLEYSEPNAPPGSTRPNGWYGVDSPGRRSDPQYAEEFWALVAPELTPYVLATAIGARVAATAEEATLVVTRDRPRLRQYVRDPAPKPGQSPWQARDARAPENAPGPDAPPTPPRGFTQYYRQTAPGPGQGQWVLKSAAAAPRR